jgi:hypothetical protein
MLTSIFHPYKKIPSHEKGVLCLNMGWCAFLILPTYEAFYFENKSQAFWMVDGDFKRAWEVHS